MKYWAFFYHIDPVAGGYLEGIGDRSVIRLDGRMSIRRMRKIAAQACKERKYDGYSIERGTSLLHTFAMTTVQPVKQKGD